MKKIVFVTVLALATIFASSCKNESKPIDACLKFDAKCEIEKEYQIVKVLQNNRQIVNAYGKPLEEGNWYFYSRNARTLIPMTYESGYLNPGDLDFADKGGYLPGLTGEVQSDTVDFNLTGIGQANILKVKMLLFGSQYAQLNLDVQKPKFRLAQALVVKN